MRPSVLNPLFASASGIKGIGQKLDKVRTILRGDATASTRIVDLLFHLPRGVVDRRFRPKIADLPKEGIVTIRSEGRTPQAAAAN
jgi:ATP-dependent DNA helicase RecG